MAYTPINWQTGDTITAEKLNRCDNGWAVSRGLSTVFDDSITTTDEDSRETQFVPSASFATASEIVVTLDSVAYNLIGFDDSGYWTWGAPYEDFSVYPFSIYVDRGNYTFKSQTAGTYMLQIQASIETAETSSDFAVAVATAAPLPLLRIVQEQTTWQQVYDAMAAGKIAYYVYDNGDSAYTYFAEGAYFDDSSSRYLVSCNGGNMTLSAGSSSGALMAD